MVEGRGVGWEDGPGGGGQAQARPARRGAINRAATHRGTFPILVGKLLLSDGSFQSIGNC
jgi:hypothetical protein